VEPGTDLLEQQVTDMVAEGVIDLLEPVQVQQQHGDATAMPSSGQDGLLGSIVKKGPIRESGQGIV
jgi:hypothetical protein